MAGLSHRRFPHAILLLYRGRPVHPKRCLNFICPAYLSDIPAIRQQEIRPSSYDTTCIMGGRKVLRTRYPLSATLSLIGAEGVFLLYSRSQTEGQRLLTCIPAMLLCYWCFGYGAWLCLALMLAAGIIAHHQKLSALLAAGILLLPATQYPATTWWSKPDLDREYVLSLDVEHYFGNIQKMRKHLETDRQILWVTYYRNLYNATHPSEINSPVSLSRNLLAWNQPGTNGLILP